MDTPKNSLLQNSSFYFWLLVCISVRLLMGYFGYSQGFLYFDSPEVRNLFGQAKLALIAFIAYRSVRPNGVQDLMALTVLAVLNGLTENQPLSSADVLLVITLVTRQSHMLPKTLTAVSVATLIVVIVVSLFTGIRIVGALVPSRYEIYSVDEIYHLYRYYDEATIGSYLALEREVTIAPGLRLVRIVDSGIGSNSSQITCTADHKYKILNTKPCPFQIF